MLRVRCAPTAALEAEGEDSGRDDGGIAVAGALVLWLGGAATEQRLASGPISVGESVLRAAAASVAILAAAYLAIHLTDLNELVWETFRHGPDRA